MLKMEAGLYLCNLNSEGPKFFRKLCSSTDSKVAGNRCLTITNVYQVNHFEGCLKVKEHIER